MGLDTSHDCFHGPYSQFMRWRCWIGKQIGIPLQMMEGYNERYVVSAEVDAIKDRFGSECFSEPLYSGYQVLRAMENLPSIKWPVVGDDPLCKLLDHSDCAGRIRWFDAKPIALRLLQILRTVENDTDESKPQRGCYDGMWPCTKRFALGLLRAYKAREDVRFG